MYRLLADAYSFDERCHQCWDSQWQEFDDFFFDNLKIADTCGFITTLNDEPIGHISWDPRNMPEYVEIGHNCILSKYKGNGYGKKQLQEAIDRIRKHDGLKEIIVGTNSNLVAPRNYESVGFQLYETKRNESETAFSGDYLRYRMIPDIGGKMHKTTNIYDNPSFFEAYLQMPRSKDGLQSAGEWHQFCKLFPNLKGSSVLDLGCGYGWHSNYAAECGAAFVLGIDSSQRMIAEATRKNADERITYQVMRLEQYDYPRDTYDCVISNLVLHYIKNLNEIYENVYTTLKPGGIFLFNIEHPVFTAGMNQDWIYDNDGKPLYWALDQYFYPGERTTNFLGQAVSKQHHTLTQILMGLLNVGFHIEAVEEAQPSKEMMHIPGMQDEMRRPMMLLVRVSKPVTVIGKNALLNIADELKQ